MCLGFIGYGCNEVQFECTRNKELSLGIGFVEKKSLET
jgi:hypothetical protein